MKRVVITGMGAITPVGNNIESFWNNLIAGTCGIDFISAFSTDELPVKVAGEVKNFNPADHGMDAGSARRSDRYAQFAMCAANQAVADSDIQGKIDPERFGVYVGSGIGGMHTFVNETEKLLSKGPKMISPLFVPMMISNIASGNIAIAHNAQGPCLPVVTACATGSHAIGEAYRCIAGGFADAIIAGGAEASIHPLAVGGFMNSKALSRSEDPKTASIPFDINSSGFVMAEGAGVIVLEEYEHAVARGAKIYAEVCGYGNTCDAHHYTAPRPDGACAARAIKQALTEAKFDAEKDVLHINAHGTSTPLNDKSETMAFKLALGEEAAHKAHICSTKSMTGHMVGAAGAIEIIAAALALKNGIVPPTIGLQNPDPECDLNYTPNQAQRADLSLAISTSLGFGGHKACVAMRKI